MKEAGACDDRGHPRPDPDHFENIVIRSSTSNPTAFGSLQSSSPSEVKNQVSLSKTSSVCSLNRVNLNELLGDGLFKYNPSK